MYIYVYLCVLVSEYKDKTKDRWPLTLGFVYSFKLSETIKNFTILFFSKYVASMSCNILRKRM